MTKHLRLVAVGDDVAVILPHELRELLDAHVGGTVVAEDTPRGIALMSESRHARIMAAADTVMERHKGALAELAR